MKRSYLGIGIFSAALFFLGNFETVSAHEPLAVILEKVQTNSDSIKVENLAKELKKLKPISSNDFKAKFKKEINGFKLTEVEAYEDPETGSSATANYKKGSQNIYLMVTDGAGAGSEQVKSSLLNYLELQKYEEPTDKSKVKNFKGWWVSFDWSMFEGDGLTSIQYLEGNRYGVVSSANKVPIDELESFLKNFSL
ncbi:hypothetical protein [Elizabethkingia anophelis]|uniref:hypothetical protein n=1 Tax=Elizabethkingia anophelis TaxID=1117645 RepID=UPI00389290A4